MEKHPFSEESILTTAFFTGHRYLPAEESRRIQEKLLNACLMPIQKDTGGFSAAARWVSIQ